MPWPNLLCKLTSSIILLLSKTLIVLATMQQTQTLSSFIFHGLHPPSVYSPFYVLWSTTLTQGHTWMGHRIYE